MDHNALRVLLTEEKKRLATTVNGASDDIDRDESEQSSLSELSSVDQHPADHASETFEREKDFSILEQVEAELADVERALKRLDDGTYGTCEACGNALPVSQTPAVVEP